MGLGGAFYGKADSDEERFKVRSPSKRANFVMRSHLVGSLDGQVLDHLYNLGERHIDTANVYVSDLPFPLPWRRWFKF